MVQLIMSIYYSVKWKKKHFASRLILAILLTTLAVTYSLDYRDNYRINSLKYSAHHERAEKVQQAIFSLIHQNASVDKVKVSFPVISDIKTNTSYLLVCYYRWQGKGSQMLQPSKINTTLCTHIIVGFALVKNNTLVPADPSDIQGYELVTGLKKTAPNLKVMLSVGGGGGAGGISPSVSTSQNRAKLISSMINLLYKCNFDGIDIDWEFPAWAGSSLEDKKIFFFFLLNILQDFQNAVTSEQKNNKNRPLLLSVAVAAVLPIMRASYDILSLAKYVDFINLMSYDYHDFMWYLPFTGHNSPLFRRKDELGYFATLNTAWSAEEWAKEGMPRSKIMVGIPTYAHIYTLATPYIHGFNAPAVGGGEMTYDEACNFVKNGAVRVFDKESQVPYAYQNRTWVGYDDLESITAKVKWIKSRVFGGVMTFDLNCDDWNSVCDKGLPFPLHRRIYELLKT
ncbi:chitinase-like protein 4 [Tachypleus tridentatus]|uniref:chitinase-like protein 4 n=1 Tax=Tachypleus tridentatus TaxID=6853 RepID=UPI003FCF614D